VQTLPAAELSVPFCFEGCCVDECLATTILYPKTRITELVYIIEDKNILCLAFPEFIKGLGPN